MPFDDSVLAAGQQPASPVVSAPPQAAAPPSFDDSVLTKAANTAANVANPGSAITGLVQQAGADKAKQILSDPGSPMEKLMSYGQSAAIGAYHGIDTFATSLLKLGSKMGLTAIPAADFQAGYDQNTEQYKQEASKNPDSASLGNLLGNLTAGAPLAAVGGVEGAGISSVPGVLKLLGSGALNAAQGLAVGSMSTQEGQGPDVINKQGALQGAMLGGALGTTAIPMASNYLSNTTTLEAAQQATPGVKVLDADVNNQGLYGSLKQFMVNNVLSKLPGVFGTGGVKPQQTQQIQDGLNSMISGMTNYTTQTGPDQLEKIVINNKQELKGQAQQLWGNYYNMLPKTPIQKDASENLAQTLLDDYGSENTYLPKQTQDWLATASNPMNGEQLTELHRQAYTQYENYYNVYNRNPVPIVGDIMNRMKQLSFATQDDLKNGLANLPLDDSRGAATAAYESANSFTKGIYDTFDPSKRKALVNLAGQVDQDSKASTLFLRDLQSPTQTPANLAVIGNALGQQGRNEAGGIALQQAYQKNLKTLGSQSALDLNGFVKDYQGLQNSPQSGIYQNSLDHVQGLVNVAKNVIDSGYNPLAPVTPATSGSMMRNMAASTAGLGAVGVAAHAAPVATGAVLAGATALAQIAKYSPVKNSLIMLNRLADQPNGSMQNFLQNKVVDQLTRMGVSVQQDPSSGNINISKSSPYDIPNPPATSGIRN